MEAFTSMVSFTVRAFAGISSVQASRGFPAVLIDVGEEEIVGNFEPRT